MYSEKELMLLCENKKEMKEKFYKDHLDFIKEWSESYVNKYKTICNDEDEYFFLIFIACEKAIDKYSFAKGDFYHLWSKITKREVMKFIKDRCKKILCLSLDSYQLNIQDMIIGDSIKANGESEFNKDLLFKDILDYVKENYKDEDYLVFLDYLSGYKIEEIARKEKMKQSLVIARLYKMLDDIKFQFSR